MGEGFQIGERIQLDLIDVEAEQTTHQEITADTVVVSACLLGKACRYDCKSCKNQAVIDLVKDKKVIALCPEQLGGLPTPRKPAEIVAGQGYDVLDGHAHIRTKGGNDVTDEFLRGANATLEAAKLYGATVAILKAKSPSCGSGKIYDGSFSGNVKVGDGVAAALLKLNGIRVLTDEEI